jgi:hypothetical protein
MSELVSAALRRRIRQRAHRRCEYCLMHEDDAVLPYEPDHIIAVKHWGRTLEDNLAWSCFACNRFKGSDIASVDLETGRIVPLFNTRTGVWTEHSRLERGRVIPLTPEGRVTEHILQFNLPERVLRRRLLVTLRRYP